jgi:release factor glutamine methyltransferase
VLADLATALTAARVEEPRAIARDILAAVLDVPRSWPGLNLDAACDAGSAAAAGQAAARIVEGAPFAYAVGRAWFRHLTLDVDERVLIPRPETELLVELVLEATQGGGGLAVDVGTGSGAIALALATEGAFDRVVATDVSLDALDVARRNRERLNELRGVVEFRHGSLLAPVRGERARAVVSNPPYIAHDEAAALPRAVRDWEPPVALFSDGGGVAATAALIREAADVLEPAGLLALEVDSRRAALIAGIAAADGRYREVAVRRDLAQRERFVTAVRL